MGILDRIQMVANTSGRCTTGMHGRCDGSSGRSDGRAGLCWCRCHEIELISGGTGRVTSAD